MKLKLTFKVFLVPLIALTTHLSFAQTVIGQVTDDNGITLPSVTVASKNSNRGTLTDFYGAYSIKTKLNDILVFSYEGYTTKEVTVNNFSRINVQLKPKNTLDEVIVTALGFKENERDLTYAAQNIKQQNLNMTKDASLISALAGKVAGLQIAGQAGSKLNNPGKVYLRGAISIQGREEALYVVDGIVTTADNVDLENIETISVLKGPNATALYGLRAASGVIVITTKSAKRNSGISVNVGSSIQFDNVAYLPKFQNEYGQGYDGEYEWDVWDQNTPGAPDYFAPMDGGNYIFSSYADESWGPRFDGRDYHPWYSWFPGTTDSPNPYYGSTAKWEASENNIKEYFDTGITKKNSFDINSGGKNHAGRFSYVRLDQEGILPNTKFTRNNFTGKFTLFATDKLTIGANLGYTADKNIGDYDDDYANATSGAFNSWFGRQVDVSKLKELKDLRTPDGFYTSWNWSNPLYYSYFGGDERKPTFWFNPYTQTEAETYTRETNSFISSIDLDYKISEALTLNVVSQRDQYTSKYLRTTPYDMQNSSNAFEIGYTEYVNSFGSEKRTFEELTFRPSVNYKKQINQDFNLDTSLGFINRSSKYNNQGFFMSRLGNPDAGEYVGLITPNVYTQNNSRENVIPKIQDENFKVNSIFSRINLEYKDFLVFNADIRNDWDSRYDIFKNGSSDNKNSILFGSAGLNFIFSEALEVPNFINFGKVWINYAEVGTNIEPYKLNPSYEEEIPYNSKPTLARPTSYANPNITPATSKSIEIGTDLSVIDNRIRLNLTYYNEDRESEILSSSVPSISGITNSINNGGLVNRKGIEITLGLTPVKTDNFNWNTTFNFAKNKTIVKALAEGQQSFEIDTEYNFNTIYLLNRKGEEWGQLVGNKIKRDQNGTPIINGSGLYETESNASFGSVLPDYIGGLVNRVSYKGLSLAATISFQKGGKFYSLTENWATSNGLATNTVGTNNLGNPIRDDITDGGGVFVKGVDTSGNAVSTYVNAITYYKQFIENSLPEPFIHDASYLKLTDISLTYDLPQKLIGNFMKSLSFGVVAKNVALLAVSKDNTNKWDPSELSRDYGEEGQLPGTRSIGFNVKASF